MGSQMHDSFLEHSVMFGQHQPQVQIQQNHHQQHQPLSGRSRSYSESQRSITRAEKRMGRLFRQNSSSATVNGSNSTSIANTNMKHQISTDEHLRDQQTNEAKEQNLQNQEYELQQQQIPQEQLQNLTTRAEDEKSHIVSSIIREETISENPLLEKEFVHSNSSSISSQLGSSTSSSTTPSINSNYTPRKFGFNNTAMLGVSSPDITSTMNLHSNLSSSINTHTNTDFIFSPQDENSKSKYQQISQKEHFTKLSTLSETVDDSLHKLLILSEKFVALHKQFILTLNNSALDIDISTKNFDVFVAVFENVEKKSNQKDLDEINENMKAILSLSLVNAMTDLKQLIENLKLYLKSDNLSISSFSLRTTYYSLFSIFTELSSICQLIVSLPKRLQLDPDFNNNHNHNYTNNLSKTNNVLGQKIKTSINQTRIPSANQPSLPGRQPSISRQYKSEKQEMDPVISNAQQDPNISNNSSSNNTVIINNNNNSIIIDDDVIFDLINHTIQAAQAVFNQMNNAIAKSAMLIAGNNNISNNNDKADDGSSKELNNIAFKVKDLTNQCLLSMEQTKKLKAGLNMIKNSTSNSYSDIDLNKNIYEQTNLFLKSIINILAATKSAIEDIPTLNEVRSSLSVLTRATKELTIKLKSSALKQSVLNNAPPSSILDEQPKLSSIPSIANFAQEQPPQSTQSPILRTNKLKQIPEQNEKLSMKPPHLNLDLGMNNSTSDSVLQTPLPVTTPLIASIGPAVASAVLPIKSPLKQPTVLGGSGANPTTFNPSIQSIVENSSSTSTTPLYFGDGNSNAMQAEYNPFDRLIPRNQ